MVTAKAGKTAVIAVTRGGALLGEKLLAEFASAHLYLPRRLLKEFTERSSPGGKKFFYVSWHDLVKKLFINYEGIIFITATGIAVRSIAPFLCDKRQDPGVVVVDEKGRFCISLLSGHLGGANKLCLKTAQILGAEPVITTATDVNKKPAVDMLAKKLNCKIEPAEKVKVFNRLLVEGETVVLFSQWHDIPIINGFVVKPWTELAWGLKKGEKGAVIITNRIVHFSCAEHLFLYPRNLVVGVGCRKGTSATEIIGAIEEVFKNNSLALQSVKKLTSIELKAKEAGLIEAAKLLDVPFETVTKNEISQVNEEFSSSDFVKKITGVGGVCEPAAKIRSRKGKIIVPKTKLKKVTVAVAEERSMWWD